MKNKILTKFVAVICLLSFVPGVIAQKTETVSVKGDEQARIIPQEKLSSDTDTEDAVSTAQGNASQIEVLRNSLIIEKARNLGFKNPEKAVSLVPANIISAKEIEQYLKGKIKDDPQLVTAPLGFCDANFVGENYTFDVPTQVGLGTLLNDLRVRFGINFLPDTEVIGLPVQISANDVPWNILLRSVLFQNDIEATCLNETTVSLIKRQKLATLQESMRKTAPIKTEYIRLKYLRPSSQAQVNLAGRVSGGAATIESLEIEIQKILRSTGDNRGSVARIPGTAEFIITGTEEQISQIKQIIEKADRPSYRVTVYALVYTVNETKLKDVGSQLSVILGNGDFTNGGGISTLPRQTETGTGSSSSTGTNRRTLGPPFQQPSGGLGASGANTVFGGNATLGSAQFSYQLTLLEQLGVARRVEKLRIETRDGTTGLFESGRQIPVVVQAANNLGGGLPGQIEFINAGSSLSATPQVVFDEDGKPYLINLAFRAESNNVDTSIQTTGVPSITGRRVQAETTFLLNQVYILAASNDTTESASISRTPFLGELPIIGEFFKRRTKQKSEDKLYFAFWVEVAYADATSTIPTSNLDAAFPIPPKMDQPLKADKSKEEKKKEEEATPVKEDKDQ